MEKQKAYIAAILIQCGLAGMMVLSKAALSSGMQPSIFVVYRQAFSTLALLPFAFFFPSKDCPPLTWTGCCKFFFVSLYGVALSFNLNFGGSVFVTPTIMAAVFNVTPPLLLISSVCLRLENLAITQRHGVAETVGTLVCLCGVMAFILYKGPPMYSGSRNSHLPFDINTSTKQEWIKGSLLAITATSLNSLWLAQQVKLLKQYPGKMRFTILQNGFSFVAASVYAAATQRHLSSWKLGWDIRLLSTAYCGLTVTGVSYWLQAWVIEKKGPIFNAIFGPLTIIIAAILSAIFLQEVLHWGRFLGCGLVVFGLYIFLWGSHQEAQIKARKQSHEICNEDTISSNVEDPKETQK